MDDNPRLVLDVTEVAELLKLSTSSAYQAVATGQIAAIRVSRRILIPRTRLEKLLAEGGGKGVPRNG